MIKYYIYIVYEDGSIYESTISNFRDITKITLRNKAYEAIKICYYDNPQYCHIITGRDNVFLHYYDARGYLYYAQFDDSEKFTKVIVLKGVGKEEIFTDSITSLPILLKGKLLSPNTKYEKLIKQCIEWRPHTR